jgi:hypothetical protein
MTTTTVFLGTDRQTFPQKHAFSRVRRRTASAWTKRKDWIRSPWFRLRPRVSLLAGSIFVLLTLYLPTVVGSCGKPQPGSSLAVGAQGVEWPGKLLLFPANGRFFYLFCLALAAFTLVFLFASLLRWNLAGRRGLVTGLLAVSGSVAFLSTTDLFLVLAGDWLVTATALGIVAFLAVVSLFPSARSRVEIWTKKRMAGWALIAAGAISALLIRDFFFSEFDLHRVGKYGTVGFYLLALVLTLLPLSLWLRNGVFWGTLRCPWQVAGGHLARFYVVITALDLLFVADFGYWGLIAFFAGAYLIFYGYWQLRQAANGNPPVFSATSERAAT